MQNGVLFALLSSLVFSIMNALVKAVSLSVPAAEVAFFRGMIGTVIIFALMRHEKIPFSTSGVPALVLRGVLGGLYMVTYFYTLAKIPLIDAIILVNLTPVFVIILAAVFLKEKLPRRTLQLLPLVFLGAVFTIKPFHFSTYSADALFGVLSAVLAGGAAIAICYLTKTHHTYEIIFYFMAAATLVAVPMMWNNFVVPNGIELFYLACIGVVSLIGQVFLTKAFTHENAVVVEVVRYIGIVYNAVWGFLFWAEVPDRLTILGGLCIIGACVALSRQNNGGARTAAAGTGKKV